MRAPSPCDRVGRAAVVAAALLTGQLGEVEASPSGKTYGTVVFSSVGDPVEACFLFGSDASWEVEGGMALTGSWFELPTGVWIAGAGDAASWVLFIGRTPGAGMEGLIGLGFASTGAVFLAVGEEDPACSEPPPDPEEYVGTFEGLATFFDLQCPPSDPCDSISPVRVEISSAGPSLRLRFSECLDPLPACDPQFRFEFDITVDGATYSGVETPNPQRTIQGSLDASATILSGRVDNLNDPSVPIEFSLTRVSP